MRLWCISGPSSSPPNTPLTVGRTAPATPATRLEYGAGLEIHVRPLRLHCAAGFRTDATSTDGEPAEVLHRAAHVSFDFLVEDPARYQLLFLRTIPGFVPSAPSYELAQAVIGRLSQVLEAAGMGTPQQVTCGPRCSWAWPANRSAMTPAATAGAGWSIRPSTY